MTYTRPSTIKRERGAAFIEYALLLAIFVPIFAVAAIAIRDAGEHRADQSSKTVKNFVPCGGDGGLLQGDECY